MSSVARLHGTRERLECQDCGGHDIVAVKDICDVPECSTEIFAKRLCKAHYQRAYRMLKRRKEENDEFWTQVEQFRRDQRGLWRHT